MATCTAVTKYYLAMVVMKMQQSLYTLAPADLSCQANCLHSQGSFALITALNCTMKAKVRKPTKARAYTIPDAVICLVKCTNSEWRHPLGT